MASLRIRLRAADKILSIVHSSPLVPFLREIGIAYESPADTWRKRCWYLLLYEAAGLLYVAGIHAPPHPKRVFVVSVDPATGRSTVLLDTATGSASVSSSLRSIPDYPLEGSLSRLRSGINLA